MKGEGERIKRGHMIKNIEKKLDHIFNYWSKAHQAWGNYWSKSPSRMKRRSIKWEKRRQWWDGHKRKDDRYGFSQKFNKTVIKYLLASWREREREREREGGREGGRGEEDKRRDGDGLLLGCSPTPSTCLSRQKEVFG